MSESLDWLPPALYPVALRIARADECAFQIGELAAQWSFDGPLDLVEVQTGDRSSMRVRGIRPIPPRIHLLFSEAVNHLRAALDNVVWHFVDSEQGPVTGRAAHRVNLPIVDDEKAFADWQRDRLKVGLTAFGSTTALGQRVHDLQPFVDQAASIPSMRPELSPLMDTPVEMVHPLKLLQGYSNQDKHRMIRVCLPRTSGGRVDQISPRSRRFTELEIGHIVAEGRRGEYIEVEQTTGVMVQRPDPFAALVSPGQEISRLTTYVAHTAVPLLVTGLALPGSLPLSVDLDDSGLTDLQRLQAGGRESAGTRLNRRMFTMSIEAANRPPQIPPVIVEDPPSVSGAGTGTS